MLLSAASDAGELACTTILPFTGFHGVELGRQGRQHRVAYSAEVGILVALEELVVFHEQLLQLLTLLRLKRLLLDVSPFFNVLTSQWDLGVALRGLPAAEFVEQVELVQPKVGRSRDQEARHLTIVVGRALLEVRLGAELDVSFLKVVVLLLVHRELCIRRSLRFCDQDLTWRIGHGDYDGLCR